ncbi:Pycsar system effector family protein [Streptomyces longispororuber]|uniref:Pycsar system effector family protein n=1 Tax=Streptomyces longispororuber TaxID=68230 RepID=UPI0034027194
MSRQTLPAGTVPGALDARIAQAHADVKAEIARTDGKVSLLLAFLGALLAGVWSVATGLHLPAAALVVGGAGAALLVAAAGVLLWAVRPTLGGARPVGFPLWATLSADEIHADLATDRRVQHIAALSRIAVAKYTRLKRAVDLTGAAGALLVLAALITIGSAA